MKRLCMVVLALVMCMALTVGALGEGASNGVTTAGLIGTWEGEVEGFGLISMTIGNDGLGEMFLNDEAMGSFAIMSQETLVVTLAREEGELVLEDGDMVFADEDTVTIADAEESMTLVRTSKPEDATLALDNLFIGKWEADIPSANMVLGFEFLADGSYIVSADGEAMGSWAYMVYEDRLITIEGEDGICEYIFAVEDENTILVTEDGVTVPFVRVTSAQADTNEAVTLASWAGRWNNFASYFENAGVQEAYEILAETDEEGRTAEQIKDGYINGTTYKCDIAAMIIEGDEVAFYEASLTDDAAPTAQANYAFVGMVADANGREFAHFEAQGDAPYKALLLLPAEADIPGETMMHFHFRYGDDAESVLAMDGWYATMTAADSTDALIVGHMTN